jgi:hypothetical protein
LHIFLSIGSISKIWGKNRPLSFWTCITSLNRMIFVSIHLCTNDIIWPFWLNNFNLCFGLLWWILDDCDYMHLSIRLLFCCIGLHICFVTVPYLFIAMVLYFILKSGTVIAPALLFLLSIALHIQGLFCIYMKIRIDFFLPLWGM